MAEIVMAVLAASVAAGYFTIAGVVAPRIRMPTAQRRVVLAVRGAAIAFFIGCGLTHVHVLVHTVGIAERQPVESHELAFHVAQAVGAWLFVLGAVMRLELQVVPRQTRAELEAAVEEERRRAQLARWLADQDELTGLVRRRRFEEELERQAAQARRYGHGGALLLLDVDGFKRVNDTFGHETGDAVLRGIGQRLRNALRASDVAGRLGGDEFGVLLPRATLEEAEVVARKLVGLFSEGAADAPAVSVGIVTLEGPVDPAAALRRADAALYAAKRAGGGRAVVATGPDVPEPR